MSRPGFSTDSPAEKTFSKDFSIEEQVGFYNQKTQPGTEDIDARAGQLPAAPDDRFSNVFTEKK
jgi:hypothetical protein